MGQRAVPCKKCSKAVPAMQRRGYTVVCRDGLAHLVKDGVLGCADAPEEPEETIARLEAEVAELKARPDVMACMRLNKKLTDEVAELKRERDLYRQAFGYVTIGDVTLEIGDDWDVDGGTVLVNDKPVEWSKDLDIAKAVVAARDGDEKSGLLEDE